MERDRTSNIGNAVIPFRVENNILGGLPEILPAGLGLQCPSENERSSRTVVRTGGQPGVARPDTLARGRRHEQGPARHGGTSGSRSGSGAHRRELGIPPGPDLALRLVPVCTVGEDPCDVKGVGVAG
jgi:hypothetical protein